MNYLQKKKLAFMSIVNQVKGFVRTMIGALPLTLEGCVDEKSIIDYKMYGQSVQDGEPTPDNPIEVVSVGEKTKNLIEYPYLDTSKTLNGLTFIDNGDGTITVNGIAEANTTFNIATKKTSIWDGIIPNETYTLSVDVDGEYTGNISYVCNYYPEGSSSYTGWLSSAINKTVTKACPTDIAGIRSYIYIYAGAVLDNITIKPQLEKGEIATPYEPYGKYKIPVTVSGKNLFDIDKLDTIGGITKNEDGSITVSGYPSGTAKTLRKLCPYLKSGKTARLSMNTNGYSHIYLKNSKASVEQYWSTSSKKVITDELLDSNVYFYRQTSAQGGGNATISNIQIEEGEVATEYEPYVEPVTTNIYLDEPLRKVGDYADYIDFESGKVVRNVVFHIFNGGENITLPSGIIEGYTPFRYIKNDWEAVLPFVCNYYPYNNTTYNQISGKECLAKYYANATQMFFITSNERIPLNDTTVFKNWLKELYTSGKPVIVYAGTSTPTETPITLPTIPTFKGTSIVSADTTIQPSNAEIEYYSNVKENNYGTI